MHPPMMADSDPPFCLSSAVAISPTNAVVPGQSLPKDLIPGDNGSLTRLVAFFNLFING